MTWRKVAGRIIIAVAITFALVAWTFKSFDRLRWPYDVAPDELAPDEPLTSPNPSHGPDGYSKTVVVGKLKGESVDWLDQVPDTRKVVYAVDDERAALRVPKNKGNEAMVYLSYIIDHYDNLTDINIMMHAHRWAWHNNDLLDNDSVATLRRLNLEQVQRDGYANLRCQWHPGCTSWLDPQAARPDERRAEEAVLRSAWATLFPAHALPDALAQACCSQLAVSRARLRSLPRAEYERMRRWLARSELADAVAGRVFEYAWQYVWAGRAVLCPAQHACHCRLYGACFAGEGAFQEWFRVRQGVRRDEDEMAELQAAAPSASVEERLAALRKSVNAQWVSLLRKRDEAFRNGDEPSFRARIASTGQA
jgi:hypothetical protein